MILPFKKLINKNPSKTSAEVIDEHLTLSLLNAIDPKIWRTPLDKIGSASFELKQATDSAVTKLILKPKKGTAEIIAEFQTKEEAFDALNVASNALQSNKSQSKTTKPTSINLKQAPPSAPVTSQQKSSKWVIIFWCIIIVIGLYYYMTTLIPEKTTDFGNNASNFNSSPSAPQDTVGVPVSADEFLNGL